MKWFWKFLLALLLLAGIADGARYLRPDIKNKTIVLQKGADTQPKITVLFFVYNANGGIYPGIADFLHKTIAPASYPCNLCYQTFGTFGMKSEWKAYLASLPYQKTFLHKDQFKRTFLPQNLSLPCVLATDDQQNWLLLSAEEINTADSLADIMKMINQKLIP